MHDVVRDVGVWIAKSSEDWCTSIIRSGISEMQISQQLQSCSDKVTRVSFMGSKIAFLPDCYIQCPKTKTLFLQGNRSLYEVPNSFLQGFQMLTTLDLSVSKIMVLPDSLLQLGELRALILSRCTLLRELPPLETLRKLQILDCSDTSLAKLPAGFEKLTNLKILLLYGTKLREIPTGKFCKLHNLECLNTKDSGIKWGTRDTIEANAPFEDLLCLNQLTFLYINLKSIPCFTTQHASWFKRIKEFTFQVINANDYSSANRNGVLLRRLHFSGDEMVGLLLLSALSFMITECEEVDVMLDSLVRNSGSLGPFVNLKKLDINCCCIFGKPSSLGRLCVEQTDLLPNLEFLSFEKVGGLESLSSFSNFFGLGFTKLKEIVVYDCDDLENLLVMDGTLQKLEKVEKIKDI